MLRAHRVRRVARLLGAATAAGALSTALLVGAPLAAQASPSLSRHHVAPSANGVNVASSANGIGTGARAYPTLHVTGHAVQPCFDANGI